MSDTKVIRRFGMVDEASGYVPIYFGETTNTPPHGVAGPEYVLLSDHAAAIEKLEAQATVEFLDLMTNQAEALKRAHALSLEAAETQVADLKAKVERLREALQMFEQRILANGEWDDGCFYYRGTSSSELQEPLTLARAALSETRS